MILLGLVGGVAATLAAGDALASCMVAEPVSIPVRLGEAFLFGAGALSLSLLVLLRLGAPLAGSAFLLAAASLAGWGVAPRRETRPAAFPRGPLPRLFAALLTLEIVQDGAASFLPPLTAWDSWVSWWSKAQGIAVDGGLTANLLANPDRLPTNAGYPLLVPLTESWLLAFAPSVGERAAGLVAFAFFAALLVLVHAFLKRSVSPTAALGLTLLLASTPRFFRLAPLGMADVPLAAYVLLAFSLADGLRRAPFAFACGLLPWTKDEGWIWLALATLGLALACGARSLTFHLPIALGAGLLWPLARAGWSSFPYVFGPTPHVARAPEIALGLVRCLVSPAWSFVWPIALLASLTAWTHLSRRERLLVAAPIAYLAIASGAYLFSRFDPWTDHLRNSVDRLALQALPLAIAALGVCAARAGWLAPAPEGA